MNTEKKKIEKINISMGRVIVLSIIIAVLLLVVYFYQTRNAFAILPEDSLTEYKSHYAFISENLDDAFFQTLFAATKESGEKRGDYVEYFGKDLATDYTREQLLEIAIDSKVDGIFLEADESQEIAALINKAVDSGIPVVTMGSDCAVSTRQSYVGVNNFSLGQEYGKQIIKMSSGKPKQVMVLVTPNSANTSQNIVCSAIKEQLSEIGNIETLIYAIDDESTFSPEESIRDVITKSSKAPDVLVCLNERNTGSAYQAIVDYNKVGKIEILGYHINSSIAEGISQRNIYASVEVNTSQMGEYLIDAMDEYREYGYVNEYMIVDVNVIDGRNVEGYIHELE